MKTTIFFGLCVALVAGFVSACAHNSPAPAAPVAEVTTNEALAVVAPIAEVPTNEIPAAEIPTNETPAVAAPTSEVATNEAPAVVVPVATARTVESSIKTQPAVALVTPKPTPAISSSPSVKVKPTNQLVTVNGEKYNNVHVEKVEPDGIIISYTLEGGGMGMTKIYLDDLSDELRQRYGFNPAKQ